MWELLFNFLGFLWILLQIAIALIFIGFFLGIGIAISFNWFITVDVEGELKEE